MTGILAMTNFLFSQIFFCIVLILIGYSQVPVLSVFVDPAIRHAVRYTDDGLFATTLIAYEKEWNETFIAGYETKTLMLMTTSSPISFWFRCIDRQLRGYFFIESLAKVPDMYFNILAYGADGILPRLTIFADGQPVTYSVGHGGGEFYLNVSSKPWHSEVVFTVNNWVRFTSFPMSKCIDAPPSPNGEEPVYMMHAHTYDHPASLKQNALLPSGVAHHLMYHRCALNVTKYELIIQPEDLGLYLKNNYLHHFARTGALTFVLKSANPSRLDLPYFSCHHQAIYENQALLRHWKSNVRIFYFNPDEYLSFSPSFTLAEFKRQHLSQSNVAFDRYMTFCFDCKVGEPELPFLSFAHRKYKITDKNNDPKLFIDPDRNGCMLVHWSHCGTPPNLLSNNTANIIHFENLFNRRWTNDSSLSFISKVFYHAYPDLDTSRMSLLKCDPGKLLHDLKNDKQRNKYIKHTRPSLGSLDLNKGLSMVSQSVSQVSNTVNINIESVLSGQPRGLSLFISEIRACKTKEQERVRVDAELGNIRQKFSNVANLSSYQKKKYVWKMCYIHMLGYEVDFGHLEFISLMASTKYSEKSVGYMAISLMLKPGDELMTLVINSMRNDIVGNMHGGQCLGLAAVSNIGGADLAEALASDVQRLIVASDDSRGQHHHHPGGAGPGGAANFFETELTQKTMLCKKASLCLLRLFRTNPDIVVLESWMQRMGKLLEDRDLGVVTSLMSLLLGFASSSPQTFEPLVPYVISILTRLVVNKTCSHEYLYYRLPCPWLQVKCLRFLQYYKIPEAAQFELLNDILSKILVRTEHSGVGQSAGTESSNRTNAEHAILFEAINLILTFGLDAPTFLKEHTSAILGRFIGLKDANTRYLGLDAMIRLAKIDGPATVQMHQQTVLDSLKDADISVRRKALGLLYVLADESNAQDIVGELVLNLSSAEAAIKEDMVVKIAIMAEKYSLSVEDDKQSASVRWYVDIMMQVLMLAGDYVAEAVWYRIVQVVTNTPDIHEYAAEKLLGTVQSKWAHETLVAVSGYLLGEIGVTICEKPGMSGLDQLTAISQHLASVSDKVKGILLTCVVKLLNLYPEQTAAAAWELLKKFSTSSTLELQQRACEYIILAAAHLRSVRGDDSVTGTRLGQGVTTESARQLWSQVNATTLESVLNPMPVYQLNNSESVLLSIASGVAAEQAVTDRSVWSIEQGEKDASRDAYKQTKDSVPQEPQSTSKEPAAAPMPPKPAKVPIQVPKPVTVDLLSMDDSPPPPPSAPAATNSFAAGNGSLSSSPSLSSLFSTAALQGKQGKGKGLTLVENSELKVTLSNFDIRGHRARIVLAVKAKNAGGLTEVSLRGYSQSPDSLIIKSAPSPAFTGLVSEGSEVECLQIAAECMRPFSEAQSPLLELSARSVATGQALLLEKVRLPLSVCSFCDPLPCDKETYMTRWRSIEGAGTESQEIFSVSGDVAQIRSLLISGCGLGLAEGLDNDRTVTGCASFTTGTVGANGVPVSVGVMMRLEVDPTQGKSRVTVRAKNPVVTQAFRAFVVEALSV